MVRLRRLPSALTLSVTPAKAGVQSEWGCVTTHPQATVWLGRFGPTNQDHSLPRFPQGPWIPACAGMTEGGGILDRDNDRRGRRSHISDRDNDRRGRRSHNSERHKDRAGRRGLTFLGGIRMGEGGAFMGVKCDFFVIDLGTAHAFLGERSVFHWHIPDVPEAHGTAVVLNTQGQFLRMGGVVRGNPVVGAAQQLEMVLDDNPVVQDSQVSVPEQLALLVEPRRFENNIETLPFARLAAGIDQRRTLLVDRKESNN